MLAISSKPDSLVFTLDSLDRLCMNKCQPINWVHDRFVIMEPDADYIL